MKFSWEWQRLPETVEKDMSFKKINPERAAEMEEIERKAFKAAKEQFYEEEYGLKVIK